MGLTSQVQPADAAYVLEADRGHHLDPLFFWAFDSGAGAPPGAEEITEHFRRRAPFYAQLNRLFHDVPGHLDHAYWVADDRPVEQRIVHDERSGLDWGELHDALGQLAATSFDARATAWRLDVFHGVRDVPGASTPATVVVLRGNHSLITGPIANHLWEGFFGDDTEPVHFPGLGPAVPHVNRVLAVARGIARAPRATVRYVRAMRAALRDAERARTSGASGSVSRPNLSPTRLNRDPGPQRTLLVLRLGRPGPLPKGFTVTALALTTISVALQRYLIETEGQCPPDLTAFVTLAVGTAPETLGINRIGWTDVALHPGDESIHGRAASVQAALGQRRETATAETLRRLTDASAIPSFLLPVELAANQRRLQARTAPRMHTVLTSIRVADTTPWALAGRPLLFGTVSPPLTSEATLTHGLLGHGDDLTLTVLTSPEVMPDARRYAALLGTAFEEVREALRREN
ncbi:wax ester/triacylglycerol synthase domain-containing protein [Rhodococcus phenolicus]|uniref:wax ester/triacylglycerol synthase domain-containing protein n=1 Tax=Rhodococcus phenolicus TaxID=263849 RepID=UPI00083345C4|nr:wax ester/triacylglycerol synthase domain-containing protein [Rhodococcus phenolicus]